MKAASSSARSVMRRSSGPERGRRSAVVMKPLAVRLWQPTLMLSSTDMRSNRATFWNVRPMPSLGIAWRGSLRMERPSNSTSPSSGT